MNWNAGFHKIESNIVNCRLCIIASKVRNIRRNKNKKIKEILETDVRDIRDDRDRWLN